VKIGKKCIVKNNVVIKNTIISDNVIICDNSTIGSTGFGFDINNLGSVNINPQIGIVFIADNVHIGSNCTIDRGKIDVTYIGEDSMIDNLVHIGHNVCIDRNACIAAQTGISGSVSIGKNLISGGQSGYAGHINIGDNVIVAAKSGVTKNIKDNSKVAGFPAINIYDWKKNIIKNKK
jgi:UDP-3-O-[3-hydroxymyristoyl] glucosamine N-acyltransferase